MGLGAKTKNRLNQKYGKLTVIRYIGKDLRHQTYWRCRCECGNLKTIRSNYLVSGNVKSCGCAKKGTDIKGQKYGTYTILRRAERPENTNYKGSFWVCRCECGTVKVLPKSQIRKVKSCGCLRKKDITGKRFGKLVVVGYAHNGQDEIFQKGRIRWYCRCDCGERKTIPGNNLRLIKSCGCLKRSKRRLTRKKIK